MEVLAGTRVLEAPAGYRIYAETRLRANPPAGRRHRGQGTGGGAGEPAELAGVYLGEGQVTVAGQGGDATDSHRSPEDR
jgi:hypothetical protein